MFNQNAGTAPPTWNIDPTYGAVGFSPEEREEAFVHKHRVLAHEALMRIDVAGVMGAWRAVRAYARALLTMASPEFETTYRQSAYAFAQGTRQGTPDPQEVIGTLLILSDREGREQGRLGKRESVMSRENLGVGLVVGTGRLKHETFPIDQTITYDERTRALIMSNSITLEDKAAAAAADET